MQSTLRHPKTSRTTTIFYFNPQFEAQTYSKENNFQPSKSIEWKNKWFAHNFYNTIHMCRQTYLGVNMFKKVCDEV